MAPSRRYRWALLVLSLLMTPMPFVTSPVLLGVLLFLAGFAISPTLIAAISWIELVVPASRLNEGMTVFTTGLVAGLAFGSAVVGAVVDAHGVGAAFCVPAAAGFLGAALGFLTAHGADDATLASSAEEGT
jgi:predicted MFS family arabinose efflux permease